MMMIQRMKLIMAQTQTDFENNKRVSSIEIRVNKHQCDSHVIYLNGTLVVD
jgi:hypothetical protein